MCRLIFSVTRLAAMPDTRRACVLFARHRPLRSSFEVTEDLVAVNRQQQGWQRLVAGDRADDAGQLFEACMRGGARAKVRGVEARDKCGGRWQSFGYGAEVIENTGMGQM